MFDTNVTIVGNALTRPEWRRFERTNALVANFKVASTARRFDKQNNRWIDGDNLRVRVNCWRRLAEGVVASVRVGDPVIVTGRMYTRDWTTESGERRSAYELEANAVGHDLARGIAAFKRGRINVGTSVVEDAESDKHVKGERTEAAPEEDARSEAIALGLTDELRPADSTRNAAATSTANDSLNGTEFPGVGYDGPINTERISLEDLGNAVSPEMEAEVDLVIARAEETLGSGPRVEEPEVAEAASGDEPGDGTLDEAAGLAVSVPEPPRNRRGRSRVAANV
jgi:single-strand DNA-binding protein